MDSVCATCNNLRLNPTPTQASQTLLSPLPILVGCGLAAPQRYSHVCSCHVFNPYLSRHVISSRPPFCIPLSCALLHTVVFCFLPPSDAQQLLLFLFYDALLHTYFSSSTALSSTRWSLAFFPFFHLLTHSSFYFSSSTYAQQSSNLHGKSTSSSF